MSLSRYSEGPRGNRGGEKKTTTTTDPFRRLIDRSTRFDMAASVDARRWPRRRLGQLSLHGWLAWGRQKYGEDPEWDDARWHRCGRWSRETPQASEIVSTCRCGVTGCHRMSHRCREMSRKCRGNVAGCHRMSPRCREMSQECRRNVAGCHRVSPSITGCHRVSARSHNVIQLR